MTKNLRFLFSKTTNNVPLALVWSCREFSSSFPTLGTDSTHTFQTHPHGEKKPWFSSSTSEPLRWFVSRATELNFPFTIFWKFDLPQTQKKKPVNMFLCPESIWRKKENYLGAFFVLNLCLDIGTIYSIIWLDVQRVGFTSQSFHKDLHGTTSGTKN